MKHKLGLTLSTTLLAANPYSCSSAGGQSVWLSSRRQYGYVGLPTACRMRSRHWRALPPRSHTPCLCQERNTVAYVHTVCQGAGESRRNIASLLQAPNSSTGAAKAVRSVRCYMVRGDAILVGLLGETITIRYTPQTLDSVHQAPCRCPPTPVACPL